MVDFGLVLHLSAIKAHLTPINRVGNDVTHQLNGDGRDKMVRGGLEGVNIVMNTGARNAFLPIERDSNEVDAGTLVLRICPRVTVSLVETVESGRKQDVVGSEDTVDDVSGSVLDVGVMVSNDVRSDVPKREIDIR